MEEEKVPAEFEALTISELGEKLDTINAEMRKLEEEAKSVRNAIRKQLGRK